MVHYGFIEDGFLRVKEIEPIVHRYRDEVSGTIKQKIISIDEQIAALPPQYKPIDPIDESRQETSKENYTIRIIPYDAGDRISFDYVEVPDLQKVNNEINALKDSLADSDYKVIKCYEASLCGEKMPYDIIAIRSERQAIRDKINKIEAKKKELMSSL
ncbi:MAG: hypothetical protein ACI4TD_14695 [Phocaeicola sp.]